MVNRHRGEIEAILDGKSYRLCLTLGALAELEHAFGEDDMLAVAERFEAGRIAAKDAIRMIGAGLRGAGYELDDAAVATMKSEGGAAGFVDIVSRLLTATFGVGSGTDQPGKPKTDTVWGVAYTVADCDRAVERLRAAGIEVDTPRPGLARGTRVATVRWQRTPTLIIEPRK